MSLKANALYEENIEVILNEMLDDITSSIDLKMEEGTLDNDAIRRLAIERITIKKIKMNLIHSLED